LGEIDAIEEEGGREEDSPAGGRGRGDEGDRGTTQKTATDGGGVRTAAQKGELESASRRAEQGGPGSCDSQLHAVAATADKAAAAAGKATPTVNNTENSQSQIEMR